MAYDFLSNQKGQAETVFEVLIAVILLGFVLTIGAYSMETLSNTKCSKEIDMALIDFTQIIEKTASSAITSRYFTFALPNCFGHNPNVQMITASGSLCSHYCPGSLGNCFLLKYENQKDEVMPVRYNCVNISPVTNINDTGICGSANVVDYGLIENSDNVSTTPTFTRAIEFSRGRYFIRSVSLSRPNLCIFKQSGLQ